MTNILIALALTVLISIGSQELADYRLHGVLVVVIYLVIYGVLSWARSPLTKTDFPNDHALDRSQWPLSGPLRALGNTVGGLVYGGVFIVTNMLSMLNPWQAAQVVRQLRGNSRLQARERRTGDFGVNYQTQVSYHLPFTGEWLAFNGGLTPKTSHSWDILGQRFAIDFVQADAGFQRHQGSGNNVTDYLCYGQPILAAADGTVISVENRVSDAPLVGWGFCDFLARHFAGNHVIIQHADTEFALYAHLIKGSVTVKPGDVVKRGQTIGRCGHTGHSSEPHLHFHLQDSADLFNGMGLPVQFEDVVIDQQAHDHAHIQGGQRVQPRS